MAISILRKVTDSPRRKCRHLLTAWLQLGMSLEYFSKLCNHYHPNKSPHVQYAQLSAQNQTCFILKSYIQELGVLTTLSHAGGFVFSCVFYETRCSPLIRFYVFLWGDETEDEKSPCNKMKGYNCIHPDSAWIKICFCCAIKLK